MQAEFAADHPDLNIQILVVNEAGRESGNPRAASGRDIPLLQDVDIDDESAWLNWEVTWRDVIVVDGNSEVVDIYNLSRNNLQNQDSYDELRQIIVDATPQQTEPVLGDCNANGSVDVSDLSCVSNVEERDAAIEALNTLPGDLDGNGEVAFADFLVLSRNFGRDTDSYAAGNIDLQNGVDFADFLILASNFGQSLAASPTDAVFDDWSA